MNITPADLAKFVHLVPVGATIPAGTEFVVLINGGLFPDTLDYDREVSDESQKRWTAEPLFVTTPEPSLADRARRFTRGRVWSPSDLDQLVLFVAELAEMIERGES